jgi:hypothetical protein
MRLYVQEQHIVKLEELDNFCQTKEKNGFTIKDVSFFEIAGKTKKLVTIEKWNV